MEDSNSIVLKEEPLPQTKDTCATCNNHRSGAHNEVAEGQHTETTFPITVRLPHLPYKTQTIVSTQDQAQDIRQSLIDVSSTFQYSCFHLEQNNQRIPDFVDISEIPGLGPDTELTLVEDPYTEKDARTHLLRVRELIGAAGDRTDLIAGINAGQTLYDHVSKSYSKTSTPNGNGHSLHSHAMAGYDFDGADSFEPLLLPPQEPPPKTIKSISLSPWNPPPYHLRSKGHLLYLQVITNEGEQHHITSHISGFFVNKSSNTKFDPFPRSSPKSCSAHSLLSLISRLSPSFESSFKALQEYNSRRDPLSTFQLSNAIPASPWLVSESSSALSSHLPDICRTQESYLVCGAENTETLRDWNEEFQTTRELPRETVQDRVFRERVTSKLFADYNEAATQGAVLIARGEVAPLNPTENRDAQIFVYNNVFYSFGADGVGTFANEGGDEAARVATGKDVMGVKAVNQLDIQGLSAPGTVIVDYLGKRLVGQSIVPGIFKQREPGEQQIDYGGVEGKDVVAENEAFAPLFKQLSLAMRVKKHPVWDKETKRHDLEASIETKGLLGTDGRKYVLDLYRITPLDVSWIDQHWIEPHSDDKSKSSHSYPHRMTVLRPELVELYWKLKLREYVKAEVAKSTSKKQVKTNGVGDSATNGDVQPPKTDTVVEPVKPKSPIDNHDIKHVNSDSIQVNGHPDEPAAVAAQPEQAAPKAEPEPDRVDISDFQYLLNPDVFSGQQPQTPEEKEEWSKDEVEVRAVCDYLHKDVMPQLVLDLQESDVGFPMDGLSLGALMHKRGINIRYLGKVAVLADKQEPRLQALKQLVEQEMISRAFKHVVNRHLRHLPFCFAGACLSHLLNCFLGSELNNKPETSVEEDLQAVYSHVSLEFKTVTPESLQTEVSAQVRMRYRYDLSSDWVSRMKSVQMLREVAQKLGLQIRAKQYVFGKLTLTPNGNVDDPEHLHVPNMNGHATTGGKKRRKGAVHHSPTREVPSSSHLSQHTFQPDDIENIVPIVKEASPKSALAEEALEAGRISLAQNQRELGQELILESLSLHEQIYGILHAEVARAYYQLSTLFYGLDDKNTAVDLARKAVIVAERTLGIDHNETILSYLNLALFEHAIGNTLLALTHVRHALDVWKIVYGTKHPDSITTINNAAVMLQHLKLYHDSRQWFEFSLAVCQEVSGPNSINTATLLFQLAQALALDQDPKGAVNRMRTAYNIFNTELGPTDPNTKEAETWLEQLTQNAVSIAKHAKNEQARRLRRLQQPTPRVTLGMRAQPGTTPLAGRSGLSDETATLAHVTSGSRRDRGLGLDERSIDELLRYIEGSEASKQTTPKKGPANPKRRQQRSQA